MAKCERLGCGLEKTRYVIPVPIYKAEGYYACPRDEDAHMLCEKNAQLEKMLTYQQSMERIEAQVQTFEHMQNAHKLEDVVLTLHAAMVTKQKREEHALGCPWCNDFNKVIRKYDPLVKEIVDGRNLWKS